MGGNAIDKCIHSIWIMIMGELLLVGKGGELETEGLAEVVGGGGGGLGPWGVKSN